jgi:pimeloyl-ACP methyl ester carboxylesterase
MGTTENHHATSVKVRPNISFAKIYLDWRMSIPYLDFSPSGDPLLFLHANGYPPECYRPLLERLAKEYHVHAMLQRPLWPGSDPGELSDWSPLTEDLLRFMSAHYAKPVIGVGHSMGGIVLLRAALYHPELFRCIILLDPVLFPPYFIRIWRAIRSLGLGYRFHPLVAAAQDRRSHFNDLERLFMGYRRKAVFKYMDDKSLQAYVRGITCPASEGGYKLCYPVEWETRVYVTGIWRDLDLWRRLPALKVPALLIRGRHSNTYWASTAHLVRKTQSAIREEEVENASHLVPLEQPVEVHKLIHSFLEENA